ncbi:hypothetical protein TNCV_1320881 [Trichonephila clavipes]|nr:hypothetical protein TNCV_1320881 [Trichonephila clavipes]
MVAAETCVPIVRFGAIWPGVKLLFLSPRGLLRDPLKNQSDSSDISRKSSRVVLRPENKVAIRLIYLYQSDVLEMFHQENCVRVGPNDRKFYSAGGKI